MKTKFTQTLLLSFIATGIWAQTGPGGVGNSATNRLWLDANRLGLANGAQVATFTDFSGNGYNFTQGTASNRPIFRTAQQNGFPAVDFDGSNDFMLSAANAAFNTRNLTWFIVTRADANTVSGVILRCGYAGNNFTKACWGTFMSGGSGSFVSHHRRTDGTFISNTHAYTASYQLLSNTTTGNLTINSYTNSALVGTASNTSINPVNHLYFALGANTLGYTSPFNGKVAECIIYNATLTDIQRLIVENYLSSKYGLAMAANDHYALEGTGHYFELAGIGMEGGNSVTDAAGTSFLRVNTPSAMANGDYMLWAHDNAASTFSSANVPTEYGPCGLRLARAWRFDHTGDVGTVTMTFDLTGFTYGDPTTYELLIDADGDFSSGATRVTAGFSFNAVTDEATWTGVTIPDGSYVTVSNPDGVFSIASGDWSNTATWSCACVPDRNNNCIVISAGHTVTVDFGADCSNLDIKATGTLTFNVGMDLQVYEDLNVDGTLNGVDGSVSVVGSVAQAFDATGTVNFGSVTLNNALGLDLNSGTYTLEDVLTITDGDFNTNGNSFTMLSSPAQTARIAPILGAGTLTGNMIIQRHITARAAGYSDMAAPVVSTTFADWDNELLLVYTYNPPNFYPSAWGYSEAAWDYDPVEAATDVISAGQGYEVYLDDNGAQTTFSATTINSIGVPYFGDLDLVGLGMITRMNDGWNLIGNPYASYLDWDVLYTTTDQISDEIQFYDETIEDFTSAFAGTGVLIAAHQGFWINVTGATPTFTISEFTKSTDMTSTFRSKENQNFGVRLSSADGQMTYTSGTKLRFAEDFSMGNDYRDLTFMKVPAPEAPALYSMNESGQKLRANSVPSQMDELEIPVYCKVSVDGQYKITSEYVDMAFIQGYKYITLEDKFTGAIVNVDENMVYTFHAAASDKEDRFVLRLSKNSPLATSGSSVDFIQNQNGAMVNFNFEEEQEVVIKTIDLLGQDIVAQKRLVTAGNNHMVVLPADFTGVFIVTVTSGERVFTRKMFR